MIDLNKKYRTRRGGEVKGLFEHAGVIRGTEVHEGNLIVHLWNHDGVAAAIGYRSDYDLIEVDEKQELLEEARRRYPVGTKYIPTNISNVIAVVDRDPEFIPCGIKASEPGAGMIYDNSGQWAEIVKEHTVEVYFYGGVDGILLATTVEAPNHIAKKKVTFYEGEGIE